MLLCLICHRNQSGKIIGKRPRLAPQSAVKQPILRPMPDLRASFATEEREGSSSFQVPSSGVAVAAFAADQAFSRVSVSTRIDLTAVPQSAKNARNSLRVIRSPGNSQQWQVDHFGITQLGSNHGSLLVAAASNKSKSERRV